MIAPLRLRTEHGMEPGRRVTWLELFFDLVFVAAVAQVGTHLRDDYSVAGLLRFSLLFVLIWWAWLGHTSFSTRFDSDDVVQRALTWLQMFLVAVMAINATDALDSRDSAGFAAAYSLMRLVLVAQFLRARRIPRARALTTHYAVSCGAAAILWLASAIVAPPIRYWLWALALTIDGAAPLLTTRHVVDVPHDAAHLPERYGLFSIILMGESMVAVMTGMEHQAYWSVRAASAAVFAMGLIVVIWWCYFDVVEAVSERIVRSRGDAVRFQIWSHAHLPLYLGIAVTGVGLEHVIAKATKEPLHTGELAILLGALASVTMSMLVLAATRRDPQQDRPAPRLTTPGYHAPHSQRQSQTPVATAHTALDMLQ